MPLAICQKSPESRFSEVMDSWFFSMCKFHSFKTLWQQLLACLNFTLDSEDLNLLVQTKKVFSMNYNSSISSQKPWRWVRLDLIHNTKMDMYINSNLNPLTNSQNSLVAVSLKILSRMITKTIPINTRIVISCSIKWGILLWIWWKVDGNWDNNMIRNSQ